MGKSLRRDPASDRQYKSGEAMSLKQPTNMKRSTQWLAHKARHFRRAEDGAIIVMTLIFLMIMLIVGGMGVDFMRFEARRALLQSTADRAVLAAADLSQAQDAKDVVIDYFEKAGFGGTIVGEPTVIDTGEFNSVGVIAKLPMNTFFLKLAGIDTLEAPAAATAIEGIANVEVSLVVDISGSMGGTKIVELRKAAIKFTQLMLTDAYKDKISISLIPYSAQVNAGPLILDEMTLENNGGRHGFSHCVAFPDEDFDRLDLDLSQEFVQEQHFATSGLRTEPVCPIYPFERIIPWSQNKDVLEASIKQLQARGATASFLGMKWATALLDPSTNDIAQALALSDHVDDAFNTRPAAYPVPGEASSTQKVIVLMADGQNWRSERLLPQFYNSPDFVAHWASNDVNSSDGTYFGYGSSSRVGNLTYKRFRMNGDATNDGSSDGDLLMQQLCARAKVKEVIIYTVAVEADAHGTNELAKCATSTNHAFDIKSDEMEATFGAIARQITELRLSL